MASAKDKKRAAMMIVMMMRTAHAHAKSQS
jgi:hypothetical protein